MENNHGETPHVIKLYGENPKGDTLCVYVEYLLQHFGKQEIDILLGDIIKY